MRCSSCGWKYWEGATYCRKCGETDTTSSSSSSSSGSYEPSIEPKQIRRPKKEPVHKAYREPVTFSVGHILVLVIAVILCIIFFLPMFSLDSITLGGVLLAPATSMSGWATTIDRGSPWLSTAILILLLPVIIGILTVLSKFLSLPYERFLFYTMGLCLIGLVLKGAFFVGVTNVFFGIASMTPWFFISWGLYAVAGIVSLGFYLQARGA
ncbi:MAG: hypothetical protein FWC73_07470 [Defluviitaleaceae bacterium]|nr:hypothetical protein [Defluviitaleaceae bacterium]